MWEWSFIVERL